MLPAVLLKGTTAESTLWNPLLLGPEVSLLNVMTAAAAGAAVTRANTSVTRAERVCLEIRSPAGPDQSRTVR